MKRSWILVIAALGLIVGLLVMRFPYALNSEHSLMQLVYLVILLSAITVGMVSAPDVEWRQRLKEGAIWLAILMTLVIGYSYRDVFLNSRVGAELFPHLAQSGMGGEIKLNRSEDGHFYVEALVNGYPVLFIVDTGASDIVLAPKDAENAKVNMDELVFNKIYSTANGAGSGASVTLATLLVGDSVFRNVNASVNQAGMEHSLLGMAFLNRFQKVNFEGNSLTLVP